MKESLAKATAAPEEFDCHSQAVELHPLRFLDWGKIEQWMRSQIINAAAETLRGDPSLPQTERGEVMRSAHQEAAKISISSCFMGSKKGNVEEQTFAFLRTFEGMLRVVHLSLRDVPGKAGKPLYTLAEVDEMLRQDIDVLGEMFSRVFDLSFPTETEDKEGAEKNPTAARQQSE